MNKTIKTELELAEIIAERMFNLLHEKEYPVYCLASGSTPELSFNIFIEKYKDNPEIKRMRFIGLDEWLGVSRDVVGSCYQMLDDAFFRPLGILDSQITFFEAQNPAEITKNCVEIDAWIAENGIDYTLLGVGMNGHIGLNEPGYPHLYESSVVDLSDTTKTIMKKYFDSSIKLERGVTLGLGQIEKSKKIDILVTGAHKQNIVTEFLKDDAEKLPVTKIANLPQTEVFLDQVAIKKSDD